MGSLFDIPTTNLTLLLINMLKNWFNEAQSPFVDQLYGLFLFLWMQLRPPMSHILIT
jgi:hypothetical protein